MIEEYHTQKDVPVIAFEPLHELLHRSEVAAKLSFLQIELKTDESDSLIRIGLID